MPDGSDPTSRTDTPDKKALDTAIVGFMARDEIQVPPLPHVVLRLQQLVSTGNFSSDDLAQIVRADQVLSATVLRYANRSATMRTNAIVSLSEAIARMGASEVVDVAFGTTLGSHATKGGPLLSVRRLVWQQAVVSAIVGRLLAPKFNVEADVGFMAGLLHDFGKVIALGAIEQLLEKGETPPAPLAFWMDLIETYHVELGIVAAAKWDLPSPLPDVIGSHHAPDSAGDSKAVVDLVNFADMVGFRMATQPALSDADIDALAASTGGRVDARAMERVVAQLPGAVSALTSLGRAPKKGAPTLVEPGPSSFPEEARVEKKIDIVIRKADEEFFFTVDAISFEGVSAVGPCPVAEGFIAKSTLTDPTASIEMFLHVKTCQQGADKVQIEAAPFCLAPPDQRAFDEMVRRHK